jgi:hypothetical protein
MATIHTRSPCIAMQAIAGPKCASKSRMIDHDKLHVCEESHKLAHAIANKATLQDTLIAVPTPAIQM